MPRAFWDLYPWIHLIGRVLFALVFLTSGMKHLLRLDAMSGYAASKGLPAPKALVVVSGLVILAGGILVVLGWHRFVGAGLLVVFLVLAAFLVHPFWRETDPMAAQAEQVHFLKDLALAGAAVFIMLYAGYRWPLSIGG